MARQTALSPNAKGRAQTLRQKNLKRNERIDKVRRDRLICNELSKQRLIKKLERAKVNRSKYLKNVRKKAHSSGTCVIKKMEKEYVYLRVRVVLLKLKIIHFQKVAKLDLDYDNLLKSTDHPFFTSIDDLLRFSGIDDSRIFTYSYFLKADLHESIKTRTHSGLTINSEDKTVNKVINHLILLLYKLSIQLHAHFKKLFLENSPIDIMDPLNVSRMRFTKTFYWFRVYFNIFKSLHYNNLSIILSQAIDVVNRQLEVFPHEKVLLKQKRYFKSQLKIPKPELHIDGTDVTDVIEKLRLIVQLNNHLYLRFDDAVNISGNTRCCRIYFESLRILTPPGVSLAQWRQYYFNRFLKHQTVLRTGTTKISLEKRDYEGLLGLVGEKSELTVSRVNDFIDNYNLLLESDIDHITDLEEADLRKQEIIHSHKIRASDSPSLVELERTLLAFWLKTYGITLNEFRTFENLVTFMNFDRYSVALGTQSPSMRFPKFYDFIVRNDFTFPLSNLQICNFSNICLHCEPREDIVAFFKKLFLHDIIYNIPELDEVNMWIIEDLKRLKSQATKLIGITSKYHLINAYKQEYSKEPDDLFLQTNTPRVSKVISATLMKILMQDGQDKFRTFDHLLQDTREIQQTFHKTIDYFYSIYYPTLNWIYHDLGY